MPNFPLFGKPNIYTSPSTFDSVALVTGSTPRPQGANLLGFMAENTNAATRWIQLFDGYAAPSVGSKPILSLKVTTGNQQSFGTEVIHFTSVLKGIVIVTSTTGPTYTAGSADMFLTCWWF